MRTIRSRDHLRRKPASARKRGGAEGQTRTVDTGIFSAVLYHLSYLGEEYHYRIRRGGCQGKLQLTGGILIVEGLGGVVNYRVRV